MPSVQICPLGQGEMSGFTKRRPPESQRAAQAPTGLGPFAHHSPYRCLDVLYIHKLIPPFIQEAVYLESEWEHPLSVAVKSGEKRGSWV